MCLTSLARERHPSTLFPSFSLTLAYSKRSAQEQATYTSCFSTTVLVTSGKCRGRNLRDATILAVDTGIRPNSELFPLTWADVDLTVRPECPHGVIHVRQGKTSSAQRSLPLTPRGAEVLLRRKREAEVKSKTSAFVFPGAGNSGHVISLQHPHEDAIEDAKLEPFEFYCWRHTFGTRAAQSGMDRFSLARLMGHCSPAVAARYYIHVTETHVAAGFGKFVDYQTRNIAEGIAEAFPDASAAVQ